jgi:hypothetical protein
VETVRGWIIEQVGVFTHHNITTSLTAVTHIFQMLEFKTANAALAATASRPSAAYKTIPGHSTSAISSGLDRLFGTSATRERRSHESSPSRREWETSAAMQRERARGLRCVHRELDEYLKEPLETFSRIERVDGLEQIVIFDILTYWQVRVEMILLSVGSSNFPTDCRKKVPKPLLPRNGCPTCASKFSTVRATLLVWKGDIYCSPE